MPDPGPSDPDTDPVVSDGAASRRFSREIGARERRKLRSRQGRTRSVWAGFGFFGLVGWSIAAPTLAGAAAGRWLDRAYPAKRSWTLALLVAGLLLGCLNAWRWIAKERWEIENALEEEERDDDD